MNPQQQLTWTVTATILCLLGVPSALAVPYEWTIGQIYGLADVTAAFHGGAGQLSTIDSITPTASGVELGVTFRVGQEADPFALNYGLPFARISLADDLGFPGLDLSGFTSSSLTLIAKTNVTVQSFLQTDFTENSGAIDDGDATPGESFSSLYWEHTDAVAAGPPVDVDFDFSNGTEFAGNWNLASPQTVQGTGAIRQWGLQVGKFSGVTVGAPLVTTITLIGVAPEPGSTALAVAATAGLIAAARRSTRVRAARRLSCALSSA